MYQSLRSSLTTSWSDNLAHIVDNYNATPNPAIGNLKPESIKTAEDGPRIDQALKENHMTKKSEPHFDAKIIERKIDKEKKKALQKGKFVMLNLHAETMARSFDIQVS